MARVDGLPAPAAEGGTGQAGGVTLSARQFRINQRISQAAVRRANALEMRLRGEFPPTDVASARPRRITLPARQLLIKPANRSSGGAPRERPRGAIPEIPLPPPGPASLHLLDHLIGVIPEDHRAVMQVQVIQRRGALGDASPVGVGDLIPVVYPNSVSAAERRYGAGSRINAAGVVSGGVMFGIYVSVDEPPRPGD